MNNLEPSPVQRAASIFRAVLRAIAERRLLLIGANIDGRDVDVLVISPVPGEVAAACDLEGLELVPVATLLSEADAERLRLHLSTAGSA